MRLKSVSLQRPHPAAVLALAVAIGAAMRANAARRPVFEGAESGENRPGAHDDDAGTTAESGRGDPRAYRPDLNRSPAHRLRLLRGLGPVRAAALVAERAHGGDYRSFEEVARRVRGLGPVTVRRLAQSADLGAETVEPTHLSVRFDQLEDVE